MSVTTKKHFYAHGKLLLTAEFLVIDGAQALAVPTRMGQHMQVQPLQDSTISWKSYTCTGNLWFEASFEVKKGSLELINCTSKTKEVGVQLQQIFEVLLRLNPALFAVGGYAFETRLEFPQDWGLGSSSTLLYNLASWAETNPFVLSNQTFGGSAYDIACAGNDTPILYQRVRAEKPQVSPVAFLPPFRDELFFVHRNQKQNTRHRVTHYKKINPTAKEKWIEEVSKLTQCFLTSKKRTEFEQLIVEHENLLAEVLQMPPVKEQLFSDYPGAVKSLGAWGGDFMLATGTEADKRYFKEKGLTTILPYTEMVLGEK